MKVQPASMVDKFDEAPLSWKFGLLELRMFWRNESIPSINNKLSILIARFIQT